LASVQNDIFKKIERDKNVDEAATDNAANEAMLFTGMVPSLVDFGQKILPALRRLAHVEANLPEGWKKEWFAGGDQVVLNRLEAMVYTNAVIHSVSPISSVENKRERTRYSCFVQVRFETANGNVYYSPPRIEKFVLVRPPQGDPDAANAQPFRVALCDVFKRNQPSGDDDFGEVLCVRLTGAGSDYQHRMYAVDLKSIDTKLVTIVAGEGAISRSNLGVGRVHFMTFSMTTGQGPL
jgi:hypothetical protein